MLGTSGRSRATSFTFHTSKAPAQLFCAQVELVAVATRSFSSSIFKQMATRYTGGTFNIMHQNMEYIECIE